MTPSEKHKAIAIAYSIWATIQPYHVFMNQDECFKAWLLTEEGKRLTAEDRICGQTCECSVPEQCPNIIAKERLSDDTESSEEVKWLRAAMETQYEAYEALAKETAQGIKALNEKLDRIEGSMKFEPKE